MLRPPWLFVASSVDASTLPLPLTINCTISMGTMRSHAVYGAVTAIPAPRQWPLFHCAALHLFTARSCQLMDYMPSRIYGYIHRSIYLPMGDHLIFVCIWGGVFCCAVVALHCRVVDAGKIANGIPSMGFISMTLFSHCPRDKFLRHFDYNNEIETHLRRLSRYMDDFPV